MQSSVARQASPRHALKAELDGRCAALFAAPDAGDDVDCLVFAAVDDVLPERRFLRLAGGSEVAVDLLWVPETFLEEPEALAAEGLLAHRLLGSDLVLDARGTVPRWRDEVERQFFLRDVRRRRIRGFLETADLTVRELAVTRDFPALSLFWMHMAHAATLAALCDALGRLCPNVYTRPLEHLLAVERALARPLVRRVEEALRLGGDPQLLERPLRRVHEVLARQFPEPAWPAALRASTRSEYRYFGSARELEWRIESARRGPGTAAVFFLRFWAYALARRPMVHRCALAGRDVSYLRPEAAVHPALVELCPEILADLGDLLGGPDAGASAVAAALSAYRELRTVTKEVLEERELS